MNEDAFVSHLVSGYHAPAFMDSVGNGSMFGELVACAVMPLGDGSEEGS